MPIVSALGRQRQEDCEFEAILCCMTLFQNRKKERARKEGRETGRKEGTNGGREKGREAEREG
jgi:hypothetical protein